MFNEKFFAGCEPGPEPRGGRMAQMDIESSSSSAAGGRKRSSAAVERDFSTALLSKRARTTEPEPSRVRAARARTLSASDALQLPGNCPSPQLPKPGRGSDTDDEAAHSSDEGGDFEGGDALDFARERALRLSLAQAARDLLARAARPPPPHLAPPAAAGAWAIVPFRPAADPWGCQEAGPGGVADMDLDPEL